MPQVDTITAYKPPRRVADTEEGTQLRQQIAALERLAHAYHEGVIMEGK